MTAPAAPPATLHYAPAPPRYRRWRRRAMWGIAIGVLALVAAQLGPVAWRHVRLLYWQRQCLRYTTPADCLVCAEPGGLPGPGTAFSFAAPDPAALSSLRPLLPGPAAGPEAGPILFMHERQCRDGRRFLVIVRRNPPALRQSYDLPLSFAVTLIDSEAPAGPGWPQTVLCYDVIAPLAAARFFAGQPDPGDEARFTIPYETASEGRRVIEGRLDVDKADKENREIGREADTPPRVELEDGPLPAGAGR